MNYDIHNQIRYSDLTVEIDEYSHDDLYLIFCLNLSNTQYPVY